MDIKHLAAGAVAMTLMATSALVHAQPQAALTVRPTNLRAGPATDYPIVAVLPPGFAIGVQGCLSDYTWCDVIAGSSRGWMWAGNISYYYQQRYVPLQEYAPLIGIGALAFILNDYWGDHYRDRPFYRDRSHWEGRRFVHPNPRYVAPRDRPGFVERRGDRIGSRLDYGTRPGEVAPRAEQRPSGRPNPGVTPQEQRELNQGGSTSVDPRLRPSY